MPELTRAQLLGFALAVVVVVGLGVRWMQGQAEPGAAGGGRPGGGRAAIPASAATVRLEDAGGPRRALVHVAGAVRRPGVYRLPDGARVQDALRRAGGAARRADLAAINLAARVADGQQVVVPLRAAAGAGGGAAGAASPGAAGGGSGAAAGGPRVSLNTATLEQLDTLAGVGPATAQKILDWRREHGGFRSVDDLSQVPGIGPKRLGALRDRVQP
jgi:competence protein ComEA